MMAGINDSKLEKDNGKGLDIENNPACLEISGVILRRLGFNFLSASSVKFGLLQAEMEKPDLIILSAKYPALSGAKMAGKLGLHPTTQSTPLIFFCSHHQFQTIKKHLKPSDQAAIHHIAQPTSYQAFIEGITLALEKKTS